MSRYRITVLTLQGNHLTFHVKEYKLNGGFIEFIDEKTSIPKIFHGSRCEIEEIKR